ncbi:hypothetical protein A0H81_00419 [Grifola frondosa]|uniref:Uncharacterized protein n=1 Tax=Grifola frondosa TaxID=5627 RepID=A0A1C7MSA7_GRIFR|nr:hypothetical protein A0H81_00419 [Grifola frondosa]
MSDNIESGTRRPSALEQGPGRNRVPLTRSCTMVVISGEPFMPLLLTSLSSRERREQRVFAQLLNLVPFLEQRLMTDCDEEEMSRVADFRGASSARSDDTKSLKGHILDWIGTPGEAFVPPIARNIKTNRGYHHEVTGSLLCPAGLNWADSNVKAQLRSGEMTVPGTSGRFSLTAYKHIFTSPSSVDDETKATRAGNARIHGMTKVTAASIAYIATQVRFALSSSSVFSRTDTVTDSERFYNSVLEFLDDINEKEDVDALLAWWNRHIFPGSATGARAPAKNSALAKLLERRKQKNNTAAAVST